MALATSLLAQAAPVTYDVTPTFANATGTVSGYRAYQGCNLAAQTTGALIGAAVSGTKFSVVGDTTTSTVVCVRAWNVSGVTEQLGAFNNVGTLTATTPPPGGTSTTYTCTLNPTSGGTCVVN